jgi:hypothetical protein
LLKRRDSTRRRNWAVVLSAGTRAASGSDDPDLLAVASVLFTKMARELSRLKTTVLRFLPRMKFLPRIVSVSPTSTFIGLTDVTTG